MIEPDSLAKPNEGYVITDEEFARAIGLRFYIEMSEGCNNAYVSFLGSPESAAGALNLVVERRLANNIEASLWEQLRHAYGFYARGSCNKVHFEQIKKELTAETKLQNAVTALKARGNMLAERKEIAGKTKDWDDVNTYIARLDEIAAALKLLE